MQGDTNKNRRYGFYGILSRMHEIEKVGLTTHLRICQSKCKFNSRSRHRSRSVLKALDSNCNRQLPCSSISDCFDRRSSFNLMLRWQIGSLIFPKIYASDHIDQSTNDEGIENNAKNAQTDSKSLVLSGAFQFSKESEVLAKLFIERETGMERIRTIFVRDHKGDYSPEIQYITMALIQTFILTFFMRYIPVWRMAREDFIREHRGTVFRTRLEAVRRMQDQISLKAGLDAGRFSAKMTIFGAGFLFLSQTIASYRNKTSVLEYSVAAGVCGGIARIHLGLRGLVAGSVVGTVLGTVVGGLAYLMLHKMDITQERRHLIAVASKLDVEKYLLGDTEFKKKVEELKEVTARPEPSS